jgi:hypothetical protein
VRHEFPSTLIPFSLLILPGLDGLCPTHHHLTSLQTSTVLLQSYPEQLTLATSPILVLPSIHPGSSYTPSQPTRPLHRSISESESIPNSLSTMLSLNRSFFLPLLLLSLLSLSSLVSAAGAHHEYPDHPGRQQHHRALAARHGASSSSSDASFIGVPPSNAGRRRQRSSSPNKRAVCSASASATSLPAFSLGVLVPNSTSSLLPQATASASLPSNAAYSTVDSGNGILTIYTTHYNTVTVTSTGTALPSLPTASTTVNNIVIPDWSTIAQAAPSAATSMPTVQTNTGVSTVDPAGAGPFSGDGTWFGTGLGACGNWNDPSDHVVAVSRLLFDSWPFVLPLFSHLLRLLRILADLIAFPPLGSSSFFL